MSTWYAPGDCAVAVGHGAIVMAGVGHAGSMGPLLARSVAPLEVLSVLSSGDVARLPDFAAALVDGDDLVVLVRGPYRIAYGDEAWSGADAATWREHRVPLRDGDPVEVRHVDASGDAAAGDTALPISNGVVLAARVTWQPPATAGGPATDEPATVEPATVEPTTVEPASPEPFEPPRFEAPTPPPVAVVDPESTLMEAEDGFDELVGATIHGHRAPDPEPAPGDHDGRTITAEQLQRLRSEQAQQQAAPPSREPAVQLSATLAISGGETVALDQPVLIGRSPRAAQMSSAELPHLIVVDDPYVSGTHLEVSLDGDSVVAVDRSTNGTMLTRPGRQPQRLAKGEPTVLDDGCVLALSDDLTATVTIEGAGR